MLKYRISLTISLFLLIISGCSTPQIPVGGNDIPAVSQTDDSADQSQSEEAVPEAVSSSWTDVLTAPESSIIINEVCLHNASIFEYGKSCFPDWVELKNRTDVSQDLEGLCIQLEDEDGSHRKFTAFPHYELEPDEYLLLVFTEAESSTRYSAIHMKYEIPDTITSLSIINEQGESLDTFPIAHHEVEDDEYPVIFDYSQSRDPMFGIISFDTTPTPAMDNHREIAAPRFITGSGFYDDVNVEFDTEALPDGYEIYYTINDGIDHICDLYRGPGSWDQPTPISGHRYTGPFPLDSSGVVKARVYTPEGACSPSSHISLFIGEDTDLPVISLVTNPLNLWDPVEGIYTRGCGEEANFLSDDRRLVDFEYFPGTDASGPMISDTYLMRIFGGFSRWKYQKSLSIYAKSPASEERIPNHFFSGSAAGIPSFHSLVLRNSGGDNGRTHFRDCLITSFADGLNVEKQDYRPALVFMNGYYWGIYNIREKINEYFIEDHLGIDRDNIDLIEGSYRSGMEANEGDLTAMDELLTFIETADGTRPETFETLDATVDIDNFIDYLIIEMFANNTDWPWSNVKMFRPRTDEGKWRFILFDTDEGFDTVEYFTKEYEDNDRNPHGTVDFDMIDYLMHQYNGDVVSKLFRALIPSPEFYERFISRYEQLLNTRLSPEYLMKSIERYTSVYMPEIARQTDRWTEDTCRCSTGDIISSWQDEIMILNDFAAERSAQVEEHLQTFDAAYHPSFYAGKIRNGDFEIPATDMWDMDFTPERVHASILEDQDNHMGYIKVLKAGKHPWDSSAFIYDSLRFEDGDVLEFSFDIKASGDLAEDEYIQVSIFDCKNNESIFKEQYVPPHDWEHQSARFTYSGPSINTGRLVFMTGRLSEGREILIDNIYLR